MAAKPNKGTPRKNPPKSDGSPKTTERAKTTDSPKETDVATIARNIGTGFLILVFGGLTQPVVASVVPVLGVIWLILVAVFAFVWAGGRTGPTSPSPLMHGALAAVLSYVLVIPLLFIQGTFDPLTVAGSLVAAVVIGAVASVAGARFFPSRD